MASFAIRMFSYESIDTLWMKDAPSNCREKLRDVKRITGCADIPSLGGRRCALPKECGGGHLPACHSIRGIVYKKDGKILSPVGRMYYLGRADGCKITVALIEKIILSGIVLLSAVATAGGRPCAASSISKSK